LRRLFVILMVLLPLLACGNKKANVLDEQALFQQAQSFEKSQEFVKAYDSYQIIIDKYPQSPLRYKALFMAGYIQLEYLKDSKKSLSLFDTLLKEYPNCDLAKDAKVIRDVAASGKDLMSVFQDSLKGK
jgi:TolA-binding protein